MLLNAKYPCFIDAKELISANIINLKPNDTFGKYAIEFNFKNGNTVIAEYEDIEKAKEDIKIIGGVSNG